MTSPRFIGAEEVHARLTYPLCIRVVRDAMIAFSRGETIQPLRSVVPLTEGRLLGVMPGAMGPNAVFGAKLISVFFGNGARGLPSHQGVVVLFDGESGAPVCIADAGAITAIRTAAASAAATDALARPDAPHLAILGTGEQAHTHVHAISHVRRLSRVSIWGRTPAKAEALAMALSRETGLTVSAAATVPDAVRSADIVCTLTSASEPILSGAWLKPGAHVNVVGSGFAGPAEVDHDVVTRARYFADSRAGVLAQGAEFLRAKAAGLLGDDHILGEIGAVFDRRLEGRISDGDITLYKSLGHVVQDLASVAALMD
jgi:ornithine cyclodeaminase